MSKFLSKKLESIVPYKVTLNDAWLSGSNEPLKLDWNESAGIIQSEYLDGYEDLRLNWYPKLVNTELIDAISNYSGVSTDSIYYGVSSDLVQESILKITLDIQDKVLLLTPTYDNFRFSVEVYGGKVVRLPWTNLDQLDVTLESSRFKMCYICNPNNPTGDVIDRNVLKRILTRHSETLFLVDEAYIEFAGDYSAINLVSEFVNIIVTRTLSKAFGLAGIRFGYCAANPSLISDLWGYNNSKLVSMFTQKAALYAFQNWNLMIDSVDRIKVNREELSKYLKNEGFSVLGYLRGNFVLFRDSDDKFIEKNFHKMAQLGLFIRSLGHVSGLENTYRISIPASSEDMALLISRLNASLRS